MKVGDFVTARVTLKGGVLCVRQAIIKKIQTNRLELLGESGTKYVAFKNVTIVPDKNLAGFTRIFVMKFRARLKSRRKLN